jgi:hypothetical protein
MFTTDGFTLAASVAMSGVPGKTGGVANGAAAVGTGALPPGAAGEAACATCLWHPIPNNTNIPNINEQSVWFLMVFARKKPLRRRVIPVKAHKLPRPGRKPGQRG